MPEILLLVMLVLAGSEGRMTLTPMPSWEACFKGMSEIHLKLGGEVPPVMSFTVACIDRRYFRAKEKEA